MANRNGMRPNEYLEASLVKVWPPSVADVAQQGGNVFDPDDWGVSSWDERRPKFYVALTRRIGQTWRVEVLEATPIEDGVIPHEVFNRLTEQRDRIIKKQRSVRSTESAAQRTPHEGEDNANIRHTD